MPDERERAEPEDGVRILDPEPDRAAQRRLGARKVRGIGGLPPAQLIREPELRQQRWRRAARARTCASSAARGDAPMPPAAPASARSASATGAADDDACRPRLGEDAADEPPEGERGRSRAAHEECRTSSHAEPLDRPTCVPCARSPGWGRRRTGSSSGSSRPRSCPHRLRACCSGERLQNPSETGQERAVAAGDRTDLDVSDIVLETAPVREPLQVTGRAHRAPPASSSARRPCSTEEGRPASSPVKFEPRHAGQQHRDEIGATRRRSVRQNRIEEVHETRELRARVSARRTANRPQDRGVPRSPSGRAGSRLR